MKFRQIAVLSLISLLLAACSKTDCCSGPEGPTPDEIVTANAILVEEAALAFASDNLGEYPDDVSTDRSASGKILIDFLPDAMLLVNPFTEQPTEPRDGVASDSGEIGYAVSNLTGVNYGYTITARGEAGELDALDNVLELHVAVAQTADAVRLAAIAYYDEHGEFPPHVGQFISLLPGGTLQINAFTYAATEPVDGASASWGQVGYVPIVQEDRNAGYMITAHGEDLGQFLVQVSEVR